MVLICSLARNGSRHQPRRGSNFSGIAAGDGVSASLRTRTALTSPMLLRARRNGMSVFSQLRRVVPSSYRPPSPQALHSTSTYSTAASVRPPILRCGCKPGIVRTQLRVLQTQANTKGLHYPRTTALPRNWSSTIHRIRHISPSAMTTQTQTRSHVGHSHHHHHHDNTFLLSKNKNDAGVRITRIGLYVNLGMAVGKGVGGYVFNSQGKLLNTN